MAERFLIVGLGSIGRRHARLLRELQPTARLAAMRTAKKDDEGAALVDETFTDWDKALAFGPDAAIVASPAPFHREAAERLLNAGVPSLIEKPLANSLADALLIAAAHQRSDVTAFVGYTLRFHPSIEHVLALVSTEVGAVRFVRAEVGQYLPDWRPGANYRESASARRDLGGGALLELSHEIDLVQSLIGVPEHVAAVTGKASDLDIDVEDIAELVFANVDRVPCASVHVDFLSRKAFRRLKVIGSNATLIWDLLADTVELGRAASEGWEDVSDVQMRSRDDSYRRELSFFLDAVARGVTSLQPSVAEAVDVMLTIEMARRASETGQTQKRSDHLIGLGSTAHA